MYVWDKNFNPLFILLYKEKKIQRDLIIKVYIYFCVTPI